MLKPVALRGLFFLFIYIIHERYQVKQWRKSRQDRVSLRWAFLCPCLFHFPWGGQQTLWGCCKPSVKRQLSDNDSKAAFPHGRHAMWALPQVCWENRSVMCRPCQSHSRKWPGTGWAVLLPTVSHCHMHETGTQSRLDRKGGGSGKRIRKTFR